MPPESFSNSESFPHPESSRPKRTDFDAKKGLPPTERLRVCSMCRRPNCTDPSHHPEAHIETEKTPEGLERWFEPVTDINIEIEEDATKGWWHVSPDSAENMKRVMYKMEPEEDIARNVQLESVLTWEKNQNGDGPHILREPLPGPNLDFLTCTDIAPDGRILLEGRGGKPILLQPDGKATVFESTLPNRSFQRARFGEKDDILFRFTYLGAEAHQPQRGTAQLHADGSGETQNFFEADRWTPSLTPNGDTLMTGLETITCFKKDGSVLKTRGQRSDIDTVRTNEQGELVITSPESDIMRIPLTGPATRYKLLFQDTEFLPFVASAVPAANGSIFALVKMAEPERNGRTFQHDRIVWIKRNGTITELRKQDADENDGAHSLLSTPDGGLFVNRNDGTIAHYPGITDAAKTDQTETNTPPPARRF